MAQHLDASHTKGHTPLMEQRYPVNAALTVQYAHRSVCSLVVCVLCCVVEGRCQRAQRSKKGG
eukprot:m.190562 g.190562  ORF g.190562 m.190562 type:complete len:63 (-) comp14822_c0_seq1:1332-1520(-)